MNPQFFSLLPYIVAAIAIFGLLWIKSMFA